MKDTFEFYSPTRIIFGKGKENETGAILRQYGFHRVLIVSGQGSAERSGLLGRIRASLTEAGISFLEAGGVRPNPEIGFVRAALSRIKKDPVDAILAVGGGSVIDTAKSIGVGFYHEGDPFDFNRKIAFPKKTLPVGVVLTIASAGSESSNSCVIQDDAMRIKQGFNADIVRPLFAIENPQLMAGVPAYHVFAGASDTMMHSLERYFNPSDDNEVADRIALAVIRSTMEAAKRLKDNPHDEKAMGEMMLNSSLSHDGLTSIGKDQVFVVHPLEHVLSAYAPRITHGAGVALLYPAWAKHVYRHDVKKFARLATALFDFVGANEEETAIMGIRLMKDFFHSIGMPTSFGEVGLTSKDIPELVSLASGNGTRMVGRYPQPLEKQDIEQIYRSLLPEEDL